MPDEREDLKNDTPFLAALAAPPALGSAAGMAAFLRAAAMEMHAAAADKPALRAAARKAARALLGAGPPAPVPGWHAPGGVDAFVAEELKIEEPTPARVMEAAVLAMYLDFLTAKDKITVARVLGKYTSLFLGLPA